MNEPARKKSSKKLGISYKELEKEINEFETRWINIFEEIKKEPIAPEEFGYFQKSLQFELSDITMHMRLYSNANIGDKLRYSLDLTVNTVLAHVVKAKVMSISKWKDKHPGILSTLASFFPKQVDFNNIKVQTK